MSSVQLSTTDRNALIDGLVASIGASPILKIRTGAPPANCAAGDSGTVLSTINLPATWLNAASGGQATKAGTWQDASADDTGDAGHFRIYDSGGAVCRLQGTVTATGGGVDMTFDSISFISGQQVTVNTFTIGTGNA